MMFPLVIIPTFVAKAVAYQRYREYYGDSEREIKRK